MKTNNKIKVVYIIESPELYEGSNQSLKCMLDGLIPNGIIPLIIAKRNGGICEWVIQKGFDTKIFDYSYDIYYQFNRKHFKSYIAFFPRTLEMVVKNKRAEKKINDLIKSFRPDIIHTTVGPIQMGYKVSKRLKIPHVWHIREYQKEIGMYPFPSMCFFKKMLHHSYIITISKDIYNYFSLCDYSRAKIIYNGINYISEIQFKKTKEKYFLFVGRLCEAKGILELINAFINFATNNKEYKLLLAGNYSDSNLKNHISFLIKEAEIEHLIEFLGLRNDCFDLMANATALIVSSKSEGFGRITAEAMFNGCLVVGNNTAGTKEQFDNGLERHREEIGLRYTGKEELVNRLQEIANNGIEQYFPMIERAQETAVNLYSIEQNVNKIYELYKKIMDNIS